MCRMDLSINSLKPMNKEKNRKQEDLFTSISF